MGNRINVAELLKDCPTGMELDSTMFEKPVKYTRLTKDEPYIITIETPCGRDFYLTKEGYLYDMADSKCIIFPKGKTTWEGFVPPYEFKDGDIIFTHANCLKVGVGNTWISIFQEKRNGGVATYVDYAEDGSEYYSNLDGDKALLCMEKDILRQRYATEEEKARLFQAIKDNGYKWNAETKTLDKLIEPSFKVGDKVRHKNNHGVVFTITSIAEDSYVCGAKATFWFADQDDYELVPNKFDTATLKPFDKVLVRDNSSGRWDITFYELYDDTNQFYPHRILGGNVYRYCIPYEGNEHLLGKTDNCTDFYKNWE
jgi:hypothetical protein